MEIKIFDVSQKNSVYYRVQIGDSLDSIALELQVPKEYIVLNNGSAIYVGKLLFLPETNLQVYVVKPFDTLDKIASIFGTTTQSIKQKNGLNSNYVFAGQKIYV